MVTKQPDLTTIHVMGYEVTMPSYLARKIAEAEAERSGEDEDA